MLCAWVVLSAGMCARRRSHFLLLRQKKVTKEKAAPLAVSLRFAAGSLRCSRAGRRCRTRFVRFALAAQTAAASQFTKRACFAARPPHALRFSARPEGGEVHSGHRCARPWADQRRCFARRFLLPLPLGEAWPVLSLSKGGEGQPRRRKPSMTTRKLPRLPFHAWRASSIFGLQRLRNKREQLFN